MSRRTLVLFWVAVAASALLLGAVVSGVRGIAAGGGTVDAAILLVSAPGLLVTTSVAGRIVFVAARLERRGRPR